MTGFQIQTVYRNMPGLYRVRSLDDIRNRPEPSAEEKPKKDESMRLKALAEAVILQSIEDLWSNTHRKASIAFFEGEGFKHCADMAGMTVVEKLRLIRMLRKLNVGVFKTRRARKADQFPVN